MAMYYSDNSTNPDNDVKLHCMDLRAYFLPSLLCPI